MRASDTIMTSLFFGILCCTIFSLSYAARPLVFIHGLTDTYKNFDIFQGYLEADFPGIKVFSLDAFNEDDSVEPIQDQIEVFSEMVRNITDEYGDITLVGHSQGAFISRAILQTTGNPHIHTLISLAAPAVGTFGIPFGGSAGMMGRSIISKLCYGNKISPVVRIIARKLLTNLYEGRLSTLLDRMLSGKEVSLCGFWNDPTPEFHQEYLKYSPILPYLNNEVAHEKSELYKQNFLGVRKLVLAGGPSDGVVTPWESTQYGYFNENLEAVEMKDYFLYKNDTFGLKTLDERNDLTLCTVFMIHHNHFHRNERVYQNCVKPHVE